MEKDIKKDNHIQVIRERFNNIAAALYLVTNHISQKELLKTNIRESIHIVLEELLDLSDLSGTFLETRLKHIRNLLKIASVANLISTQNVALLDNEIGAIELHLKEVFKNNSNIAFDLSEILSINTTYNFPQIEQKLGEVKKEGEMISRPQSSNRSNIGMSMSKSSIYSKSISGVENTDGKVAIPRQSAPKRDVLKDGFSARQNLIIKEIKSMGQLTIRDLIGKIEGCSEKTIQRELLSLVEVGVLKKEGERRWSRYSIV